jgi:hypothetical protein
MAEQRTPAVVSNDDVALLLRVVRYRCVHMDPAASHAIALAMEGLRWLLGYDTPISRASLEHECAQWEQRSVVSVARAYPDPEV